MLYDNNSLNFLENDNLKEHDIISMQSGLSSGKQTQLKPQKRINIKENKINKIFKSSYSFSDKTIGNEISKPHIESLEDELLSLDIKQNNKLNKKEKAIYLSHSDYYYCPGSKTEKNLNDQIMKYLYENNLIHKKNSSKNKKVANIFNINYNNFQIIGNEKEPLNENKIFQIEINNNSNENQIINEENIITNNNKVLYTNILSYNLEKYLEQMKGCNNFNAQINQINNIKIKNIFLNEKENITKHEKRKGLKKKKKIAYNLDNKIIIDQKDIENINKIPFNDNLYRYKTFKNNNISSSKNKPNKKISRNNIVVKKERNKNMTINKIKKTFTSLDYKNKNNAKKINLNKKSRPEFEIAPKKINEEIIFKNKKNNNKNNLSCLSNISLQSINDSKLMLIADDIVSKNENLNKLNSNNITFKKK